MSPSDGGESADVVDRVGSWSAGRAEASLSGGDESADVVDRAGSLVSRES